MTEICGATMAIGEPHGLRSGVDHAKTVLIFRRDKRTAWIRPGLVMHRSKEEPRSPRALWLEASPDDEYSGRYAITDALIWWVHSERTGLDPSVVAHLRGFTRMGELVKCDSALACLQEAREQVEGTQLSSSISLFLALATGDDPLLQLPPVSDTITGMLENLRNLDIQYEIAVPIASRMIPGMGDELVEATYQADGDRLALFSDQ